jgi:hypothetical protein
MFHNTISGCLSGVASPEAAILKKASLFLNLVKTEPKTFLKVSKLG